MAAPEIQLLVCVNDRLPPEGETKPRKPSCAPRGGLELYRLFKDRVRELGLRDRVMVTRTGCLKHCSRGIVVAVQPLNLWYARVTAADVDEILEVSLLGGEVERLRMPDIPWE